MKISLFSQSLFALGLSEAIRATARIGFPAIELACRAPHFDLPTARKEPEKVAEEIREAGLEVAALSLFTALSDPRSAPREVDAAGTYIRLAPMFGTGTVKLTLGPPSSAEATSEHWACSEAALNTLVPQAREAGVRLAVETHMRQLTDTLTSARRLARMAPGDTVGLTVDFLNLAFAGENTIEVLDALADRMFHVHIKNGYLGAGGAWMFQALDRGMLDIPALMDELRARGYGGYLSIECLGPEAGSMPVETAGRDLAILRELV